MESERGNELQQIHPMDDGPTRWMADLLNSWLRNPNWSVEELIGWLQGYNLPAVGHDEDVFVWLLRGLPLGEDRHTAEVVLGERVATLLDGSPDVKRPGKRPDDLVYNLFMLCAGLSCPDQLCEALYRVYQRQKENAGDRALSIEQRAAMRVALAHNQLDSRLHAVWQAMLTGQKDEFLLGNHFDGYEGVLLMPQDSTRRGKPFVEAICAALTRIADAVQSQRDCRPRFRDLVKRVPETYPSGTALHIELMRQAETSRWPDWAVECLPSLYVVEHTLTDGSEVAFVWHYVARCLRLFSQQACQILSTLCKDQIVELKMEPDAATFARAIAPIFEYRRLGNPFASKRSTRGVVADVMAELNLVIGDSDEAAAVEAEHLRVLHEEPSLVGV